MSEPIKKIFNEISPHYDQLNHLLSFNIDKSWRKKTIARIPFDSHQQLRTLDVCAGTLDLTLEFLKKYPTSKIWALDFSHEMLLQGKNKIPPHLKNQVHIICKDALALPFPKEHFDVVFCGYGLRNLDDKQKGIQEMQRVLKPGGYLLILEFFRPLTMRSRLFYKTYSQFLVPVIGQFISKHKKAYRHLHDSIGEFYSLPECVEVFKNKGFKNILSKNFLMGISSLVMGEKT